VTYINADGDLVFDHQESDAIVSDVAENGNVLLTCSDEGFVVVHKKTESGQESKMVTEYFAEAFVTLTPDLVMTNNSSAGAIWDMRLGEVAVTFEEESILDIESLGDEFVFECGLKFVKGASGRAIVDGCLTE
jgi:hypothetical protein